MIPGMNLAQTALSVIRRQPMIWYKYYDRVIGVSGLVQSHYLAGVNITGSLQPMPREKVAELGLSLQKRWWWFYTPDAVLSDEDRDNNGDQLTSLAYDGVTQLQQFQARSRTPWSAIDGWNAVIMDELGPAAVPPIYTPPEPTP